jgi:hypothetical protein
MCTFEPRKHQTDPRPPRKNDIKAMKRHSTYSTCKRVYTSVFIYILCCTTAFPQEDSLPAPIDSLLNLYSTRTGEAHTRTGQELMDFYAGQSVFFGEAPAITSQMRTDEQDMYVWFATERYLTTISYYKEAMPYISRTLELAGSHRNPTPSIRPATSMPPCSATVPTASSRPATTPRPLRRPRRQSASARRRGTRCSSRVPTFIWPS